MKRTVLLSFASLLAAVSMAEDPAETLKRFRAPVKVVAVNVKVDATWG